MSGVAAKGPLVQRGLSPPQGGDWGIVFIYNPSGPAGHLPLHKGGKALCAPFCKVNNNLQQQKGAAYGSTFRGVYLVMAAMWSGVVPQQPPNSVAPISAQSASTFLNRAGDMS